VHRFVVLSLALALAAGCGAPISAKDGLPVRQANRVEYVPDEIVVKFKKPDGIRAEAALFPEDIAPTLSREFLPATTKLDATSFESRDDTVLLKVAQGAAYKVAQAYAARADVEWAIPNVAMDLPAPPANAPNLPKIQAFSNDPLANQQWFLERIHAPQAWATSTGAGVTVAILDTGVDAAHPDFGGAVEKGADYVTRNGDSKDLHGHGTHVAGIVGARKDNGLGVAGVAPGCNLLAIRVLGESGRSGIFSVARGIKFAADHARKTGRKVVINLSLGASLPVDPVDFLLGWYAQRQGALLVAAAGNDGGPVGVPARHRYFMAVAATDDQDRKAGFSNFGKQLAISAPGVNILSTTPTYPVNMTTRGIAQNYAPLQGTSMAAPVVSGVAALVWSRHKDWTAAQVKEALQKSAKPLGDKDQFGAGLVDAAAAVGL
jgi:subtilisin family serine protease